MRKWLKYGYWSWPWKDVHLEGKWYGFIGLGPVTLWWEGPMLKHKKHRFPWLEWNYDEWDTAFESSQDFISALATEAADDFRAGRTEPFESE